MDDGSVDGCEYLVCSSVYGIHAQDEEIDEMGIDAFDVDLITNYLMNH